ncbi:MAG: short-chain dehydrogenase [Rhodospirillaceae bacterium]|jgi:NAD(P)-dependent dehydrogenase (short-subunit alcohol dehydrogenase family)|nr:short-chain dehydrogenase [Rhodospirillaceae bacterium]|tara:strand:+ start:204 stop:1031 length:828 start_codon:yes stop_codon:yes gene_type:complete
MSEKDLSKLFDLFGRVAVVTGGTGIQGTRITRGLAAYGADVGVIDLDEDATQALADEIKNEYGVNAIGVACDVSNKKAVTAMVAKVCDALGAIHVLHNNAASKTDNPADFFVPFEDFDFGVWRDIMSVNIDGMFLVAQAIGKQMIAQGTGGSIIQTASTYGIVGPDFGIYEGSEYMGHTITTPAAYSASKGAVVALTKYLATYWGDKGIRVNTLVPGGIESGQNETFQKNYGARVPLGRMAHVDEMVGAVVYLASDASSYMTGQMVVVDGGWTAW